MKGLEFFTDFFNAILYKKTLEIKFQGFIQNKPVDISFHPYYLRQYNNRWFVFGKVDKRNSITNIAFDRVQKLKESKLNFSPNDLVDFNDYFEDAIGVSIPDKAIPEKVILKIDKILWPYIESKPIHGSQKTKNITEHYTIVELNLIINFELISLLFSHGEGLTVIEPTPLSNSIKSKSKSLQLG